MDFLIFVAGATWPTYAAALAAANAYRDALNLTHMSDEPPVPNWTYTFEHKGDTTSPDHTKCFVATMDDDEARAVPPAGVLHASEDEIMADPGWFGPGPDLAVPNGEQKEKVKLPAEVRRTHTGKVLERHLNDHGKASD